MTADELARDVGRRLLNLRTERGMTQATVAEKSDLSLSYIGMLERGDRLPHIDVLTRVAKVFDVPIAVFFTDTETATDLDDARFARPIITVMRKLELSPSDVTLAARVVWALYAPKGERSPV